MPKNQNLSTGYNIQEALLRLEGDFSEDPLEIDVEGATAETILHVSIFTKYGTLILKKFIPKLAPDFAITPCQRGR